MKKETIMKLTAMKKRVVLLLAAAMLLPMVAVGCQSAQNIIKQREKADEIGQRAEQYMQEKYNRGFKVRKCEAAEGEEYEGDFFISFNNGVHAFYNSKKDKFYDDHQTETISEAIMRDIFLPMCNDLGVTVLNVNDKSVYFNLVYQYHRAGKDYKFSMFEKPFTETAKYYTRRTEMSVTTDNLILLSENRNQSKDFYNKIKDVMANYFHNQKEGSLDFYVVNDELQSRLDFDPDNIDESVNGCLAHIHFGEEQYCSVPNNVKIEDGLYSMVCGKHDFLYEAGDITLVPVENPEEVLSSMKATMDKQDVSLIDKYTGKKRNIVYEDTIYKLEFSQKINRLEWEDLTLAFIMRTSDGPITEYVEMNEKQHAFFAYDMNGGEYNATCLCSQDSRSTLFTFNLDSEVYFWFGSQS